MTSADQAAAKADRAPVASLGPSLSAQAGHAVRWSTATTLGRLLVQLGAQVLLARLIGPADYGVYALGLALLTFANFIAGSGFSHSLVLRPSVTPDLVRLAFSWQVAAGATCALALALAAPAFAALFRAPDLVPTLRWMALACLLSAGAGTALCLLQRALDFRRLGLLQLAAYGVGYLGVGLPLALAGWQAQALAVACVVQAAATLVLSLWVQPHALRPLWRDPGSGRAGHDLRSEVLATGRRVFVTNLVNWVAANLDRLVVGRWLPAQAVGWYALAWNLAQIPTSLLVGAAQPALLASGTRVAGDPQRLARAWLPALAGCVVLLPPVAVTMALLASDLVGLLYGPAWAGTGPVLALMLLGLPAWTAWALATPVLWHTGQPWREATLQLPLLALAVVAWLMLAPRGALAVAGVSLALTHARAACTVAASLHRLGLRVVPLAGLLVRGGVLAAACGIAGWAALGGLPAGEPAATGPAWHAWRLAVGALGSATCGVLLVLACPALIGPEAQDLLRRVLPPGLVRRLRVDWLRAPGAQA
jgi:lipopolysaccharide exporter